MDKELSKKFNAYLKSDEYKNQKAEYDHRIFYLRKSFLSKFTREFIDKKMTIDDYCLYGNINKDSFCFWVEYVLDSFGDISGVTSAYQKYVLYRNKNTGEYKFGDKRTKQRPNFGSKVPEIFISVKKELLNLIDAVKVKKYDKVEKDKEYETIAKNPLNPNFKNKVAFLYSNDNEIPIYGFDDLKVLSSVLKLGCPKDCSREKIRETLYDFYCDNGFIDKVSPYIFMRFLYSSYGYISVLRIDKKTTIDISHYTLIDVDFSKPVSIEKGSMSRKMVKISDPLKKQAEKIEIGKLGEKIVGDYLSSKKSEWEIKNIISWCDIDDSKGYDFSYETKGGKIVLIEVKATTRDFGDEVYFEMSTNELDVMNKNKDKYFVYYINNVRHSKVIQRLDANQIHDGKPTHYLFNFETKDKKIL